MKNKSRMKICIFLSSIVLSFQIVYSTNAYLQSENTLIVADRSESSVKIFSINTYKEIGNIKTDEGPNEIAVSNDGKKAVVSNYGIMDYGSTLTVIDLENYLYSKTIDLGEYSRPHGIVFLPDENLLAVTLEGRRSLALVDIDSGGIIRELKTGQDIPHLIVLDEKHQRLFISNIGSGTVSVVELNSFTLLKNIFVGKGAEGIDISPDGKEIWVTSRNENSISIINSKTLKVEKKLKSEGYPVRLKFTPDGKHVLVSNIRSGYASVFDTKKKRMIDFIVVDESDVFVEKKYDISKDTGGKVDIKVSSEKMVDIRLDLLKKGGVALPFSIDIQPDGKNAYISYRNKNFVSIVDLSGRNKWKITGIIQTRGNPDGIAYATNIAAKTIGIDDGDQGIDSYWNNIRPFTEYSRELNAINNDDFVREYESMFLPVFSGKETDFYNNIPGYPERKSFILNYIRSQDENPVFPVNYWFLEFSTRISHVKQEFLIDKPPFIDDRGKFYLKYGRPDKRFIDRGGLRRQELLHKLYNSPEKLQMMRELYNFSQPAADFNVRPNETWYYDRKGIQIVLHFVKDGYYKAVSSLSEALISKTEKNKAWHWMELIKDRYDIAPSLLDAYSNIELFEESISVKMQSSNMRISSHNPHYRVTEIRNRVDQTEREAKRNIEQNINLRYAELNSIDFDTDITQFKSENNKTRIEIVFYILKDDILFDHIIPKEKSLKVEYTYIVQDSEFNTGYKSESVHDFDNSILENIEYEYLISETSFNMTPINSRITCQIKDNTFENYGFKQDKLTINDFSGSKFMLSGLKFYMKPEDEILKNILQESIITDLKVVAYPFRVIKKSKPVFCYFEMYNMLQNRFEVLYDIEIILFRKHNESLMNRIGNIFSQEKERNFGLVYQRQTTENNSKELVSLDFSDVEEGVYLLEIKVTDQIDKSRIKSISKEIRVAK